jgi:acetyltransferase-like isoleucine patch superfamily enzyme
MTKAWGRGRRLEQKIRARVWSICGWADVGTGVQVGRGCRRMVEPGGVLVLGPGSEVDDAVTLAVTRRGRIEIGRGAFIGHHSTIASRDSVVIGDRTFIAELVSIRDHDHDPDHPPSSGEALISPVRIGQDV